MKYYFFILNIIFFILVAFFLWYDKQESQLVIEKSHIISIDTVITWECMPNDLHKLIEKRTIEIKYKQ